MSLQATRSKFKLLPLPIDTPGKCICCGAVDRPVLDFGISVDFENLGFGVLYLCVYCITEAASIVTINTGSVVTEEVDGTELQAAKDELNRLLSSIIRDWNPRLHNRISISPERSGESENDSEPDGTGSESNKSDKTTDKPASNKRSNRIPSSSSDGAAAESKFGL